MSRITATSNQWLDSLPAGWKVIPAKAAFAERRQRSNPLDVHLTPSQKYGVLPQIDYMQITGTKVVLNLEGQDNMKHVEADDFIIHLRSFQGGIERSRNSGKVSMAYTVLTPRTDQIMPGYFYWLLKADAYIQELRSTTDQLRDGQSIKYSTFSKIPLPLPPLDEQRAIADYLDQETARIDALVAKQEELIGLLRERRQTVVRTATGWGRSLPEGWRSSRLSHLFKSTGSGTTPANEDILVASDGDVAWVTTGELRERRIEATQKSISYSTLQKYSALKVYAAGTLLVAMYGATIGRTGILMLSAATNQACCALVGPVGVITEFVEYSLMAGREWLLSGASGGGQPNINQDKVRAFRIPVPPIDEQRAIVKHVEDQTSRIDTLIAKAEDHIALAKERRAALITAAVTGQLDVRAARKAG